MKILVSGDFVPRNRIAFQVEKGDYSCLDNVIPLVQAADYAIVNFESPVVIHTAKPIDKTGPNLRCTEQAMECIAQTGFKCVTLANNHFRDQGQVGVEDTLAVCQKYGIDYVGGGKDIFEAQKVLYKTINGQTLAIINVCENEWSIASNNHGGSAPLNLVRNYYDIQEARKQANHILVIVHGGIEGYQYPTPRMQETYRFLIDAGADAVVNHHQHCFSGYEEYNGKPIFYGLGNFCFDNNSNSILWQQGYLVNLSFERETIGYSIVPYTQCGSVPAVVLLKDEELNGFNKKLFDINSIIKNPEQLLQKFIEHTRELKKNRLLEFEPFANKFVRKLQSKKMLPSFVSKKTRKDIYNVINCESHREVILQIFNQMLS